jgi:outer membrane protein assembly factor BamB/HEAT repeat protein
MTRRHSVWLALALAPALAAAVRAADADSVRADEQVLRDAGQASDGAGLLDYFRKRTLVDADRRKIADLIRRMGDDSYSVREKASQEILLVGPAALGQLREATKDADLEVSKRARAAVEIIEKSSAPAVGRAAARLLADRKPAEAAEVLLTYLPYAEDASVTDEVLTVLTPLAVKAGKADPAVLKALEDKAAIRRAAAGEALCRAGTADQRALARKLLKDAEPLVRLRVGLALVEAKEKEALPVLIELLSEKGKVDVAQVEDLLYLLAGDKAPNLDVGSDAEGRRKYREAWEKWWSDEGKAIDLAKFDPSQRMLGYTLIAAMDNKGLRSGKVFEIDRDGKVRWTIDNLNYPVDAQMVGAEKVLITEYRGRAVTLRNTKGDIEWKRDVPALTISAQRLPNGNFFIVSRSQLLEIDKDGKEVSAINRGNDIAAATRGRDGRIGVVTTSGMFVRLDSTGKEEKSFALGGAILILGGNLDMLPGGKVLIPLYSQNKVVEFDADGKKVWEANAALPSSAVRLPNGHTLVANRSTMTVTELDHAGKEVWSYKSDSGFVLRARRR